MNIIRITFILLLSIPFGVIAQSEDQDLNKKEIRKARPAFIGIDFGINISNFRDFATSPLVYNGVPLYVGMSYSRLDELREVKFGLSYSFGSYHNEYNNNSSTAKVNTFSIFYSRLYRLSKISSEKFNFKAGGLFNATSNIRINEAFGNNGLGIEFIPTLLGSFKATMDVSRKESREKKFLFFKCKQQERKRNLSFQFNIGIVNMSYRNGYAYSGQSFSINQPVLLDNYEFKLFSGFRMSSSLDYNIYLKNKNQVQFSYLWDAYKTGGDLDKFEMASHVIKISLLFKTNK